MSALLRTTEAQLSQVTSGSFTSLRVDASDFRLTPTPDISLQRINRRGGPSVGDIGHEAHSTVRDDVGERVMIEPVPIGIAS